VQTLAEPASMVAIIVQLGHCQHGENAHPTLRQLSGRGSPDSAMPPPRIQARALWLDSVTPECAESDTPPQSSRDGAATSSSTNRTATRQIFPLLRLFHEEPSPARGARRLWDRPALQCRAVAGQRTPQGYKHTTSFMHHVKLMPKLVKQTYLPYRMLACKL